MKSFNDICLAVALLILVTSWSSCKKDKGSTASSSALPIVTTAALTNITATGATAGGTITSSGSTAVMQSGVVWSMTNPIPTTTDNVVAGSATTGSFTAAITGLDWNKIYYIRAFATNRAGTGYGKVVNLSRLTDTAKVRFTYNGQQVVYGIIVSPTTRRRWLDRNLGAQQVATAFNDYLAYGDQFQWGRPADGHQLINWTSSTSGVAVNGMTSTLATSDTPGHSNFIIADTSFGHGDWRTDNNMHRWATNAQGPCPSGWHVPTKTEWSAEVSTTQAGGTAVSGGITNLANAYNILKLTTAGFRYGYATTGPDLPAGALWRTGEKGAYWCSSGTISGWAGIPRTFLGDGLLITSGDADSQFAGGDMSGACSIRCIQN